MVLNLLHLNVQPAGVHLGGRAILGNGGELAEDQPAQGIILLLQGQGNAQGLSHILQRGGAGNPPGILRQGHNIRHGLVVGFIVDVADDFLQQVLHGHDAAHAAVLIHHNGHVDFLLLHVAEQRVRLHGFRHKVGLADQLAQGAGLVGLGVEQKAAGAQHADDIVHILVIDGEAAQPGLADGPEDGLLVVANPDAGHVGAVGHHILSGAVVELEDILDHFLLGFLDGTALPAHVHHHADFLLGHLLGLGVGIDAHEAEDAVGAGGQQPHNGLEGRGAYPQHTAGDAGHLLRVLHGNAFGHQFAQHQGEVGQNQGDDHHAHVIQRAGIRADPQGHKPPCQARGKPFRRKGGTQEARQGDAHLDGGQETVGGFSQAEKLLSYPVALLRVVAQLDVVQRKHGHLCGGKPAVDQDQDELKQQGTSPWVGRQNDHSLFDWAAGLPATRPSMVWRVRTPGKH